MKKRIVALIGALTLTFAMSLNVFAAGSITADNVNDAIKDMGAGDTISVEQDENGVLFVSSENSDTAIEVVVDRERLSEQATKVNEAQPTEDGVVKVEVKTVEPMESVKATVAAVKVMAQAKASYVDMTSPIEITPPADKKGQEITMAFNLNTIDISLPVAGEEIWAIDCDTNKWFKGVVKGNNVYFTSSEFSKYVIAKVKVQAASTSQPPYNPDWDPAVQAERQAAAQAQHEAAWAAYLANGGVIPVVAVAPKTGDVVAMISIMAVIFLGGAVTAVAMSKKRA